MRYLILENLPPSLQRAENKAISIIKRDAAYDGWVTYPGVFLAMALRTPDECMSGHGTKTCCRAIGKLPESLLWHDRDVPRFSSLSAVWCPLGDEGLLTVFCQRLSPMKERAISNIPDSCDLADTLPTCLRSAHPFPSESGRKRSRRAWHTPFRFAEVSQLWRLYESRVNLIVLLFSTLMPSTTLKTSELTMTRRLPPLACDEQHRPVKPVSSAVQVMRGVPQMVPLSVR